MEQGQQPDKERTKTPPVHIKADTIPQISQETLSKLKQEHPEWFQPKEQSKPAEKPQG